MFHRLPLSMPISPSSATISDSSAAIFPSNDKPSSDEQNSSNSARERTTSSFDSPAYTSSNSRSSTTRLLSSSRISSARGELCGNTGRALRSSLLSRRCRCLIFSLALQAAVALSVDDLLRRGSRLSVPHLAQGMDAQGPYRLVGRVYFSSCRLFPAPHEHIQR